MAAGFWNGFRAMTPLWLGVVPFGAAYAVTARSAGLSVMETQLLSLLVFAGGAQFSAAGMVAAGASGAAIVLTTFLINARHFLYGLSLGQWLKLTLPQKLLTAHFLTDEAYGVTLAQRQPHVGFFVGAELSLFIVWNLSTLAGSLLSEAVPDPAALGVDFIFPLAFLALLMPLLLTFKELAVAALAGTVALLMTPLLGSGLAILAAGVLGSLVGALLSRDA